MTNLRFFTFARNLINSKIVGEKNVEEKILCEINCRFRKDITKYESFSYFFDLAIICIRRCAEHYREDGKFILRIT